MFDWNDLKHFLVVARAGGTPSGASVLNLSQPAAVRGMTALERDLGLSLFNRSDDGGYKLTDAGQELLGAAGLVEEGVAAFTAQADRRSKQLSGTIRVTTNETFANLLLMPSLAEFNRRHPDLRIDVLVEDRMMDLVKGEAHVALRGAYSAGKGAIVGRRLHDLPWSVYCSRDYVQRHGGTAPAMADLAEHAAIGGVGGVGAMPGPRWLEEKAGKVATRSNNLTSMLAATRSGMGLAALPCVVGDPEADLVVCFHLPKTFTATLWLVTRTELRNNPLVKTFGAYMAERAHTLRALFEPRAPGT